MSEENQNTQQPKHSDLDSHLLAELRTTLSKMELSLGVINDAIVWVNELSIIQWCNEKFNQLVNKPHILVLGESIENLLPLTKEDKPIHWKTDFLTKIKASNDHHYDICEAMMSDKKLILEIDAHLFHSAQQQFSIVITIHDITEKQIALKKIQFLASFPEKNTAPIFSVDRDKKIIYANQAGTDLIEIWRKESGKDLPKRFYSLIDMALDNKKEYLIEEPCDQWIFLFSITSGLSLDLRPDHAKTSDYVNIYGTNITERKKSEEQLRYLSQHDILTDLYNRHAFEETIRGKVSTSAEDKTAFAILLIDLDNFKTVNDTLGHYIGDQLLKNVAQLLRQSVRKEDFVARLGGDEFIIILSNISSETEVGEIAHKFLQLFNKPFKLDGHYFHVSVSIGIAIYPHAGIDQTALIKNADIALYAVKEFGRNNYKFFTNELSNTFERRTKIETGLHTAIEKNEFFLVYQPQYKLPDKKILGIEVLLRWRHPELGLVAPDEFIPIAEKDGLITSIGEWVIKTACQQYMNWLSAKLIPKHLKLSINLSPIHLSKENFIESLSSILKSTGMIVKNLEFELTETSVMASIINLDPIFYKLKQMGIRISIDDFGIGYSSLSRIKDLPISTLKIDKSFIQDIDKDPDGAMIVKSIIALGNSLGLNVIPEGVETETQLQLLQKYNCSMVQGFYFSKHPLTATEMKKLLSERVL